MNILIRLERFVVGNKLNNYTPTFFGHLYLPSLGKVEEENEERTKGFMNFGVIFVRIIALSKRM
jgi:hypothetical protein